MYGTEFIRQKNVDTPLVYLSRFYGNRIPSKVVGLDPRPGVFPSYFFNWDASKKIYMMSKSYFIIVFYIYKVKFSNRHVLFIKNH